MWDMILKLCSLTDVTCIMRSYGHSHDLQFKIAFSLNDAVFANVG